MLKPTDRFPSYGYLTAVNDICASPHGWCYVRKRIYRFQSCGLLRSCVIGRTPAWLAYRAKTYRSISVLRTLTAVKDRAQASTVGDMLAYRFQSCGLLRSCVIGHTPARLAYRAKTYRSISVERSFTTVSERTQVPSPGVTL